jgi:hypothetical protein
MKTVYLQATVLLLIACVLLVADRYYRIEEGFAAPPDAVQCGVYSGVDNPRCGGQPRTQCINGYCQDTYPPVLPVGTGLPVYP